MGKDFNFSRNIHSRMLIANHRLANRGRYYLYQINLKLLTFFHLYL